jgi:nuclear pore complex protein Nup54
MDELSMKWDPGNPNCVFKSYLYNKVDEAAVPHYRPGPYEDPSEWEEALQNKPGPNYIPVLCPGFKGLIARVKLQEKALREFNLKLHQINACLDEILSQHDLNHSVRAFQARQRHDTLKRRCLILAAKVQVMRNRGFALSSDEDDLRLKLQTIDRSTQDPALTSRMEELWSRLIVLRGYADNLKAEMDKHNLHENMALDEEVEAKAKKVSVYAH